MEELPHERKFQPKNILVQIGPKIVMEKPINQNVQQCIGSEYFAIWLRDRCYDFLNIFAEKFCEKIGVFDLKQAKF
jgi:hypothetical protein